MFFRKPFLKKKKINVKFLLTFSLLIMNWTFYHELDFFYHELDFFFFLKLIMNLIFQIFFYNPGYIYLKLITLI